MTVTAVSRKTIRSRWHHHEVSRKREPNIATRRIRDHVSRGLTLTGRRSEVSYPSGAARRARAVDSFSFAVTRAAGSGTWYMRADPEDSRCRTGNGTGAVWRAQN